MADPPFGFHVHSMPGAGEQSGCQEPRDDASVLDGGAERAIPLGISGVARRIRPAGQVRVRAERTAAGCVVKGTTARTQPRSGRSDRADGFGGPEPIRTPSARGIVAVGLTAIVLLSAGLAEAPANLFGRRFPLGGDQLIRRCCDRGPRADVL